MEARPEIVKHNFPNGEQEIKYRVIANEEMEFLGPLFERLGWPKPDPNAAKIVVAEVGTGEDALILGFGVVEFVCHVGAMWVNPGVRGTGIAEGLCENVMHYIEDDSHIKRYVCVAKPGSFSAKLAVKYGMAKLAADLYMKQV